MISTRKKQNAEDSHELGTSVFDNTTVNSVALGGLNLNFLWCMLV